MSSLILFGCGGHSRSVADVALDGDPALELIFVDSGARAGETIFGFPVVKELAPGQKPCIISLGDNARRREMFLALEGANFVQVLSKRSYYGQGGTVGAGTLVAHSAHLGPLSKVGRNSIVNTGAVIDHESTVGDHCHIGPNATVSGRAKIGDSVFLGVGATVIDFVNICSNCIIGAGSTVIRDIVEPGTYVGSPALRKK